MRASSQQLSIPFSQPLYLAREKLVNKEAGWAVLGLQINRCLIGDQQNIIQETENTITVVLTRNILIYKLENHVTRIFFLETVFV